MIFPPFAFQSLSILHWNFLLLRHRRGFETKYFWLASFSQAQTTLSPSRHQQLLHFFQNGMNSFEMEWIPFQEVGCTNCSLSFVCFHMHCKSTTILIRNWATVTFMRTCMFKFLFCFWPKLSTIVFHHLLLDWCF